MSEEVEESSTYNTRNLEEMVEGTFCYFAVATEVISKEKEFSNWRYSVKRLLSLSLHWAMALKTLVDNHGDVENIKLNLADNQLGNYLARTTNLTLFYLGGGGGAKMPYPLGFFLNISKTTY